MKLLHSNIELEFEGDYFTGYCCYTEFEYYFCGKKKLLKEHFRGAETCWCQTWWKTWQHLWDMIGYHGQMLIRFEE